MATTYQGQLDAVRAVIAAVETGGQDVSYEGRRVTMASLPVLYAREERLVPLAARETTGVAGIRVRYGVPC